jgi:broad specificity phosphatase PhoE
MWMQTKTYYIFRHGETFVTKSKGLRLYGLHSRSIGILPEGIPTIKRLAEYLKDISTDNNVCSEYLRCKETAKIVTDITGKKFTYDPRLNEYFFESFWHFKNRIKNFIDESESSKNKTFLICTHGAVVSGLTRLLLAGKFNPMQALMFPRPGVLTIISGKDIYAIDFNKQE